MKSLKRPHEDPPQEGLFRGLRFLAGFADRDRRLLPRENTVIIPLTVREILDEHIAQKLA